MDLSDLAIEMFCQFDPEKKGYITKDQLLDSNTRDGPFSEIQIQYIFSLLDKDDKGVITLSDFTDAFLDVSDGANPTDIKDCSNVRNDENERVLFCAGDVYDNEDDDDNYRENIYDDVEDDVVFDQRKEEIRNYLNDINDSEPLDEDKDINNELRKFNSAESLFIKNHMLRTSSAKTCLSDGHFDEYWWEHGQRIDGLPQTTSLRRVSVPTLDENLLSRKLQTNLLQSKQWRSYDYGMDRCYVASNNTAFEAENNISKPVSYNTKTNDINRILNKRKIYKRDKKYEQTTQIMRKQEKLLQGKEVQASQELDEIFGSTAPRISSSASCNNCVGLNSESGSSDDSLYIQKITRPILTKFMSQSITNLTREKVSRPHRLLRAQSSLDLYDSRDTGGYYDATQDSSVVRRKDFSIENLLSHEHKNGFHLPCEHVSTSRDNLSEEWEGYLRRIGGVSLFAGNQKLRYVWQQIGAYQKNLTTPLEDFLKGIIEEHKSVYTRCQDLENTLHTKIEQHERDVDYLYEDFERTMQRELLQLEKKHCDREESLKSEFHRIVDLKEQIYQDNLNHTAELSERLEHCGEEIYELQTRKSKSDEQCRQLLQEQQTRIIEAEHLVEENAILKEKENHYQENIRDLQDYISQMLKNAEEEKEQNRGFMRQFKDLLEEKEFLEANISNLSMENAELRNLKQSLSPRDGDLSRSFNILDEASPDTTPGNTNIPLQPILNHSMSLLDELNTPFEKVNELSDPLSSLSNHLQESESEDIDEEEFVKSVGSCFNDSSDEEKEAMVDQAYTSTPRRSSAIRFASAVQSQFKVIFCGDCGVGKTSIIHRICFNRFSKIRQRTTQIDSYTKVIETGESEIKLNFWDTVGQERFNSLPRSYYRKSDVVVLVYDIGEERSFVNAKSWIRAVHDYTCESVLLLLVGNKSDLNHRRNVQKERGELLAKDNDAIFIETSAKSGENIDKMINMISSSLLEREDTLIIRNDFERSLLSLNYNRGKIRNTCC